MSLIDLLASRWAALRSGRHGAYTLAGLIALAATVLMTWPLAPNAADHLLAAIFYWDGYTNTMIMAGHVDSVTGRGPLSLYDNYFFAPLPRAIVFNENLFGLSFIFAPLYMLSGSPLWAYNATLLVSMALSVFFTFLLLKRLTGNALAGIIAGVAFAFSPYVMFELGRIQLVATQWIPACFWALHRAFDTQRRRDIVGFWLCYLLQIGTCLYYAMFLIPLLLLVGVVQGVRQQPPLKVLLWFGGVGIGAGAVALSMVHPYFAARENFDLERSLSFASSYDGKLSFLSNVFVTNRTLTWMHHMGEYRGAYEEIAFPGFTLLSMTALGLGVAAWRGGKARGPTSLGVLAVRWLVLLGAATTVTLLLHNMLAGIAVLGIGLWFHRHAGVLQPFSGARGLYLATLLLAVVMYLGLFPLQWGEEPVRGLYYYFHTYFPGFNGIRKVSRQAVMTTFLFAVLGGFGMAWLLGALPGLRSRSAVLLTLLGAVCFELRCFPHPITPVWSGETVPEAYRFMQSLPQDDLVATVPLEGGAQTFRGDAGLAYHNYLMAHHKHRSFNGQSSWQPPVTDLVFSALRQLPHPSSRQILQSVGLRHLLVHGGDLPESQRRLPEQLAAQTTHFQRVFQQGTDTVFTLSQDPALALLDTPALPNSARLVPSGELRGAAPLNPQFAQHALDGRSETFWSTVRAQSRGQSFEVQLSTPKQVIALEIENGARAIQVPLSYDLRARLSDGSWQTLLAQEPLRVYRDQVYSPKSFVFRLVLPQAQLADRIRLSVRNPVPGQPFAIHELRLYEAADAHTVAD